MLKKIALTLFLVITLVVVAVLAIGATRPPTYHVERSQSMTASPDAVFAILNDLHRFPEWSPWQKLDPGMKITQSGPASGVGASYAWVGNDKVGEGRMTITDTTSPGSITETLEFIKPFQSTCTVHFTIAPDNQGSRVTWAIDGNNNYMSKVMSLFMSMDSMMGKDFESGLANLKTVSESAAAQAATPSPAAAGSATAAPGKP